MRSTFITLIIAVLTLTISSQTKTDTAKNGLNFESQSLVVGDASQNPEVPSNIIELNNSAVAKGLKGNYAEAIIDFQKAYTSAPQCLQCGYNLATAFLRTNKFSQAAEIFRQLVKIKPDYGNALSGLGEALYHLEKPEESIAVFRRAVELLPNDAPTFSNYGIALDAVGDLKSALQSFETAVKLDPQLAVAHSNRGAALFKLGRYKEAIASFRRALEVNPNAVQAHNNLGVALSRIGKNNEAHAHYLEAVRLNPDYSAARYNLAMSYLERGDRDQARKQMTFLEGLDTNLSALFRQHFEKPFVINAAQIEADALRRKP
jgi:tetratricopeptide (TPR) repeat protein